MPTFVFSPSPYLRSQIVLGSLVDSITNPQQDAYISSLAKSLQAPEDFTWRIDANFRDHYYSSSNTLFRTSITKLVGIGWKRGTTDDAVIEADEARTYELKNPKKLFAELKQEADCQKWLQETCETGLKCWFVVGYRTLIDGRSVEAKHKATQATAHATAPTAAITGDLTGTTDVKFEAGHETSRSREGGMVSLGERIYAICYREVKLGFPEGEEARIKLKSNNAWKAFSTTRTARTKTSEDENETAADTKNEDDEDVMEANIEDLDYALDGGGEGIALDDAKIVFQNTA